MGHGTERVPHLRYPHRDPDETYELYEDVEPTDNSRPSPKGRGLLVTGPGPQPDQSAKAPGEHLSQGCVLPCC